jgi:hypothetical protein
VLEQKKENKILPSLSKEAITVPRASGVFSGGRVQDEAVADYGCTLLSSCDPFKVSLLDGDVPVSFTAVQRRESERCSSSLSGVSMPAVLPSFSFTTIPMMEKVFNDTVVANQASLSILQIPRIIRSSIKKGPTIKIFPSRNDSFIPYFETEVNKFKICTLEQSNLPEMLALQSKVVADLESKGQGDFLTVRSPETFKKLLTSANSSIAGIFDENRKLVGMIMYKNAKMEEISDSSSDYYIEPGLQNNLGMDRGNVVLIFNGAMMLDPDKSVRKRSLARVLKTVVEDVLEDTTPRGQKLVVVSVVDPKNPASYMTFLNFGACVIKKGISPEDSTNILSIVKIVSKEVIKLSTPIFVTDNFDEATAKMQESPGYCVARVFSEEKRKFGLFSMEFLLQREKSLALEKALADFSDNVSKTSAVIELTK